MWLVESAAGKYNTQLGEDMMRMTKREEECIQQLGRNSLGDSH